MGLFAHLTGLLDSVGCFLVAVEVEAEEGCAEGTDGDLGDCEFEDVNDQECDPDEGEEGQSPPEGLVAGA